MQKITIIDDLLSTMNTDADVRDIRQGVFHTAVLTRNCGLAATLPRDALKGDPPFVQEPGSLLKKSALQLAQMVYSQSILEAAMGMACINSLLQVDESKMLEMNARELIFQKSEGKKVAIIGHFPFVKRLGQVAGELWVIEKNPREEDLLEDQSEKYIPQADVVGITGTAFTNHSIGHLLDLCRPSAYVIVLGDSAPLSAVLFDYAVDAVCGTRVTDEELAMNCVSQGATYRQIQGIRQLAMVRDDSD
jgi:uncharacterized protein (DUF4213/DUF364 family)